MNGEVTFGEMFAGVGGFRLGLERTNQKCGIERAKGQDDFGSKKGPTEQCGARNIGRSSFNCVWANEWNKYACQIYRKNFGNKELVESDIHNIKTEDLPDFDLLTAGFPCPTFSLAGKREGFNDPRGKMFFEIARIAEAKRPKILLLENVKGLLSHDNGDTFETILRTLGDLGYWWEYQVFNSKHFGVPQNRERVFIVGHFREGCARQIFPIGEASELSVGEAEGKPESGEASTLEATYGKTKNLSNMVVYHQNKSGNVALHEEAQALRSGASHSYQGIIESALIQSRGLETRKDGLSHCVKGGSGGTSKNHIQIFDGHHKQFTKKMGTLTGRENRQGTNWLVANCLDQDGYLRTGARPRDENGKPQLLPIGYRRVRRLTPIECERLQGFPDDWTEGVSDTQRYKLLGNAVTVNVIEYLGRLLLKYFSINTKSREDEK